MIVEGVKLTKIYNVGKPSEVVAVKDVSVRARGGRVTALRGPSGGGKTTLLAMLGLILTPTSGRVLIDGEDVTEYSDYWKTLFRRKHVGFIFQHINLLPGYNAIENVLLPVYARSEKPGDYRERAMRLLKRLGVAHRAHASVDQLSGGELQRVAIARALLVDPDVIIADEPSSFVDEETAKVIRDVFLELRDAGKTIIVSTHDPFLLPIADKMYILNKVIMKEEP